MMKALLSNTKAWVAFLVFLLIIVFIFRQQMGQLITNIQSAKVSTSGVELTVSTPIGEVTNSAPIEVKKGDLGSQCNTEERTYCNEKYGFLISWPKESWKAQTPLPESRYFQFGYLKNLEDAPVVVDKGDSQSALSSVAVSVLSPGFANIDDYINNAQQAVTTLESQGVQGQQVDVEGVDHQGDSAVLVIRSQRPPPLLNLVAVRRVVIHNGRTYQVTTNLMDADTLTSQDQEDLNYIINSFRVFG